MRDLSSYCVSKCQKQNRHTRAKVSYSSLPDCEHPFSQCQKAPGFHLPPVFLTCSDIARELGLKITSPSGAP
jgi:hypothetical protein